MTQVILTIVLVYVVAGLLDRFTTANIIGYWLPFLGFKRLDYAPNSAFYIDGWGAAWFGRIFMFTATLRVDVEKTKELMNAEQQAVEGTDAESGSNTTD